MGDFLNKKQRSILMSKIKSKNTKPELEMSKLLDEAGIPHVRNVKGLPGTPDFVSGKVVVLVNGSFWHGKGFGEWKGKLKPFWLEKISRNMRRDRRVARKLRGMGFKVLNFWEEDVWKRPEQCIRRVSQAIAPCPCSGSQIPRSCSTPYWRPGSA